ncbi:hypothetical protein [Marinimicrobium agarilyticum]|uniref:hypothetical protein n=1 Tax=Marinimicrobium agarilyticum TaxID=306546 RepID=UPI00041B38BF|nr:hypothetical protein [Marinimicrobium agarilyticum]
MADQHNRRNAAWRAAQDWRQRAQSASRWRGPKLFLAWLVFGVLMVMGLIIALVFLLIGWIAMPFLRHRLRKRTEHMRAQAQAAADRAAGRSSRSGSRGDGRGNVIEGDYSVEDKNNDR